LSLRRLLLSVFLTFGLLSIQQAAVLHEIGHFSAAEVVDASGQESRTGDAAHAFCEKCLAFAQVANAVGSQWLALEPVSARLRETTPCAGGTVGQAAPQACSRDPPRFL
jgi:hypothetical protein